MGIVIKSDRDWRDVGRPLSCNTFAMERFLVGIFSATSSFRVQITRLTRSLRATRPRDLAQELLELGASGSDEITLSASGLVCRVVRQAWSVTAADVNVVGLRFISRRHLEL